jgi:hypothetical protein
LEIRSATESEVRAAQAAGKIPPLVPLALDMCSCFTPEEVHANFYATLDRGYTSIIPLLGKFAGQTCSLVGAGPSLRRSYMDLKGDVFSVNSALWFLLDKGIAPKYQMIWDAHEVCEKFAVPHPEITYLVASRCHPKVFERLKGCDVRVWHAGGDHDILEHMVKPEVQAKMGQPEPLINGGSAGITRGLFVVDALGYTDIHVHGADSSYEGDATHIMGSVMKEKDMMCSMGDGSEGAPATWFRTTPEWTQQVHEYRTMYALFSIGKGMKMQVHGEGMLPVMHRRVTAMRETLGDEETFRRLIGQDAAQAAHNAKASGLTEAVKSEVLSNPPTEVANACN